MATSTWATIASVGSPPLISRSGAGACTTASSQARQAYLGRCVTITRNCAGITSSRSEVSSPITMHGRAAAGAVGVFGLDRHIARAADGREARRDWHGASRARARAAAGSFLSSSASFAAIACSMSSSARQQLLGIELLRTAAELRALQLAQQMPQAVVLRQRLVALGDRGVTLRARRREQRMQGFDIGWKLRCDLAHAQH